MKTLSPLQRATVQMSVGIAVLTAVTEVIYVILALAVPSLSYEWKFTVGNIFMAAIMALNFYLMARGVYQAVDTGDQDYAKRQIHLNHTVRTIIFVLALVSCFLFGYGLDGAFRYEPGIAACITVIYPQLTVFLLRMTGRFDTDGAATAAAGDTQAGSTDTGEGTPEGDAPAGEAGAAPSGDDAAGEDRPLPPTDADGEEA